MTKHHGLPRTEPNGGLRHYRRRWEESRGDEHDAWGASWWFIEVGPDGYPTRQLELYDDGHILRYSADHCIDDYGGLSDQQLDLEEFGPYAIAAAEFEAVWAGGGKVNPS